MRWTVIQGGEIGVALSGAGAAVRVEVIARVDLAAPRQGSAPCQLVLSAKDGPAWDGSAPAAGRSRIVLRGTKPASVTLIGAGREAAHAAFAPERDRRLELEGPALRGDERLLVGMGRDPLRGFQLPGLAPRAHATFPDGSLASIALDGIALDVDLDRDRVSLFWRGTIALPRGAGAATLDDIAVEARVAPAWPIAPIAIDLHPLPPSPACAPPIDDDTGLVATSFPWRLRPPKEASILVVKGTFDLVEGGPARRAADQDALAGEELHVGERPAYPGDFAPYKPRADVLLRGHAYARPGATTAHVELSVGTVSAKVAAIGPRRWMPDGRPSEPAPFDHVALRWENAFGGPGSAANPAGAGLAPDDRVPQLERPGELIRTRADRPAPAGLSPIPRTWEARARRAGTYGKDWQASRWPHFPEDFDWTFWCTAPPELQTEALRGDEAYRITSVLPGGGDLQGRLPGVKPRGFAERADGAITEVPLRLDTVLFDADRRKVVLVWRGALEPEGEAARQRFLIVDEPLDAPRSMDEIRRRLAARRGPEPPAPPADPALMREVRATLAERRPLPGAPRAASPIAARPSAPRVTRRQVERWLAAGERLAGRDLSGADLSGIDLSGRDLTGALLRGAILDDAILDGARGEGIVAVDVRARRSSWKGAELRRANFARADLTGGDLSGATIEQASFADAELEGLVAARAVGSAVQLVRARMPRATFEDGRLDHADLSGATLDGARFTGAILDDAKLYEVLGEGIVADRASLADARFEAARLARASFRAVRAAGSMWEGADLGGADFSGAELAGAGFTGADLTRARLGGADLSGAKLRLAALAGASFTRADLMRADLDGAATAGADFSGANLYQAETGPGRLAGAKLAGAFVKGTKLA